MITVILTAYKEEKTISKALKFIADPTCSGYTDQIHLIQISPDKQTLSTATNFIKSVHNPNLKFEQIKDPGKSKPNALNMALEKTNSDLVILTDGDVSFAKNALKILVSDFKQNNYDLAGGRPVSTNERAEFMGYISHLMTTAAHDKRMKELSDDHKFFPLSGYMLILSKNKFEMKTGEKLRIPDDCLVDDAYISYKYFNNGFKLGYIPEAKVKVKFPTTLGDYFKQKKRSTGGYLQLWKYNIVTKDTNSRSIWQELKYFFFPLKFAKKPIEFFYSLIFYPVRLYLWAVMWFERKLRNKAFSQTWVRVESTK